MFRVVSPERLLWEDLMEGPKIDGDDKENFLFQKALITVKNKDVEIHIRLRKVIYKISDKFNS